MIFKVWLKEHLDVPPHLPEAWWKETLTAAKELESKFVSRTKDVLNKAEKFADDELGSWFPNFYYMLPSTLRLAFDNKDQNFSYQTLSDRMKEYEQITSYKNMSSDTIKMARNRIDMIGHHDLDLKEFITKYTDFFRREYGYKRLMDDLEDAKDNLSEDQYNEYKKTFEDMKVILDAIFDYVKLLKKVKRYVDVLKERDNVQGEKFWNGKEVLPKHNATEVMYHATPYSREIEATNFKTKEELGFEALGGHTDGAISFTADFKIAMSIAQAFKDAINIANGKMTVGDVMKLFNAEKIPKKELDTWVLDMKGRQNTARLSKKYDGKLSYREPFDPKNNWRDSIEQYTFDLYKWYLHKTQARYNPAFFGVDIRNFKGLDPTNVGVFACKIDMSKVVRYLVSMEEYRVSIDGILTKKRIR